MTGNIFDIKEMTVHDGSGIRLTVFLKGCPLRCEWCHNPEGLSAAPQLMYKKNRCLKCGQCHAECEHEECKPFHRCVKICPVNALFVCGKQYTPRELANIISGHKRIFDLAGGGVTFSGGEPLLQWAFLREVIRLIPGIHVGIETCGYADKAVFEEAVSMVDEIIMDIKLFDEEKHIQYTGVSNQIIKENFLVLRQSDKPFTIRTPLIERKTDTEENLAKIREFIGDSKWERLPENKLAKAKYEMLVHVKPQ